MFKVGVNGFGTIGSRVAAAIQKQNDIKLVGAADVSPSWRILYALGKAPFFYGLREYGSNENEQFKVSKKIFSDANIETKGTILDLLKDVDLIVDCTPKNIGRTNKDKLYSRKNDLHALFQGGEKASIAKVSFNSYINYRNAIGERFIRIPSCNTTGILRYLDCVQSVSDIKKVVVNLIRRGGDPPEPKSGPINDYVPTGVPSHHADDVIAADSRLDGKMITYGVKVPITLMHMHNAIIFGNFPSREKILDTFRENPRMVLVGGKEPPTAAQIMDANERKNLYQIAIPEKTIHIHDDILVFSAYIHQEADVIPENIDAIRASLGHEDPRDSIERTNRSLDLMNTKKKLESYFPVY
jgi:glyceraldehyde-3-phosphate dehydrogenase (NAD(P))